MATVEAGKAIQTMLQRIAAMGKHPDCCGLPMNPSVERGGRRPMFWTCYECNDQREAMVRLWLK